MESEKISSFRGEYFFLSNFYMAIVTYNGCTFTNSEAAFQAQKCTDPEAIKNFCYMSPSEAKKHGRRVILRKDWEDMKIDIMHKIVYAKFTQNPELKEKLLATGDSYLEEDNNWGDCFWGTVNGIGKNHLGKILMQVRKELRDFMQLDKEPAVSEKTLVILERSNGMYGGYVMRDGQYEQVFNTDAHLLFMSIKDRSDKGYDVLKCLDKSNEEDFMRNRRTLEDMIETMKEV